MSAVVLFNCDFRTKDNPAFFHALKNHKKVTPIFILDDKNKRKTSEAFGVAIHHALELLAKKLKEKYSLNLILKKGDSLEILSQIFKQKVTAIYFNEGCEPDNMRLCNKIKNLAKQNSIEVFTFHNQTIFEFEKIKNQSGSYFKVFTPFFNHCKKLLANVDKMLPEPDKSTFEQISIKNDDLNLLPKKNWTKDFNLDFDYEKIEKNLDKFLSKKVSNYKEARNLPALEGTSKISVYLSLGLISIKEVLFKIQNFTALNGDSENLNQYLAEIFWREFCHHLLYNFPNLLKEPFKKDFEKFPWIEDDELLKKWQKGQTGFPIVDAGMRELWHTGLMHNRIRMVVGSFLVKDLLISWTFGEEYFHNCLLDYNLANNAANWQWVAGCGADAAPYFRIFNPVLQGQRFDPDGSYVRKWIPEIAKLPDKFIHQPWMADAKTLEYYKIKLGETYPKPIVDHSKARDMALMIYKNLK
jgi:deoxyribodipyrimidine photo-lyase